MLNACSFLGGTVGVTLDPLTKWRAEELRIDTNDNVSREDSEASS